MPLRLGPELQETIPEVVLNTRVWREAGVLFQKDDIKFEEPNTFYVEPSLFEVFDFQLLHGDNKTALSDVRSAVISEATAIKYFGTTDVMGKTITKDANEQFTITGVLANAKTHSHLNFDILLPWAHLATWHNSVKESAWGGSFAFYTYITYDTPKDEAYLSTFAEKLRAIFPRTQTRRPGRVRSSESDGYSFTLSTHGRSSG